VRAQLSQPTKLSNWLYILEVGDSEGHALVPEIAFAQAQGIFVHGNFYGFTRRHEDLASNRIGMD
jgi:hypothetical protein